MSQVKILEKVTYDQHKKNSIVYNFINIKEFLVVLVITGHHRKQALLVFLVTMTHGIRYKG